MKKAEIERRYGRIREAMGRDGLDACVYKGAAVPVKST